MSFSVNIVVKSLIKTVSNNLGLKTFALFTAIALFSLVHSEEEARRTVMVDVVALLPSPRSGKLLISDLPNQIKVTLKGSRSRIRAIQREDLLPVQMDLTDGTSRYFHFDPATVDVPAGIDITQVEPSMIALSWAKATDKTVPVRVRLTGSFTAGLELRAQPTLAPAEVTLRGPEEEMRTIFEARAASIAIDGLSAGAYERLVPLEPLPRNVKCLEEPITRVRFAIVPVMVERTFHGVLLVTDSSVKALFRPSKLTIAVRGPGNLVHRLDPNQLEPSVDMSTVKSATSFESRKVVVSGLPDGVEVTQITPPEVMVKLR